MAERTGASNLTGFTSLINTQYVRDDIDLREAEREVIGNISKKAVQEFDPVKDFSEDIDDLLKKVGIDDNVSVRSSKSSRSSKSTDTYSESDSRSSKSSARSSRSSKSSKSSSKSSVSSKSSKSSHRHSRVKLVGDGSNYETKNDVPMSVYDIQTKKTQSLSKIKSLMGSLESEGIDCSNIPVLDDSSDLAKIDAVLNRLRIINDSNRATTIVEEVLVGAANVVEYVLDGTQKIPGTDFAPDYTNYPKTLEVRLRSMRYETSEIISNIVETHHMGSVSKLILTLLPGFLLYPRVNKQSTVKNSIAEDARIGKSARLDISTSDSRHNFNKSRDVLQDL